MRSQPGRLVDGDVQYALVMFSIDILLDGSRLVPFKNKNHTKTFFN